MPKKKIAVPFFVCAPIFRGNKFLVLHPETKCGCHWRNIPPKAASLELKWKSTQTAMTRTQWMMMNDLIVFQKWFFPSTLLHVQTTHRQWCHRNISLFWKHWMQKKTQDFCWLWKSCFYCHFLIWKLLVCISKWYHFHNSRECEKLARERWIEHIFP